MRRVAMLSRMSAGARLAAAMVTIVAAGSAANLEPGDQRRWTIEFRTRLEQPGGERPAEIAVTADLVSTVAALRPGEYDAAMELIGAHFEGSSANGAAPERVQTAEGRLARRFWATYRDDGTLLAVHFFKDVLPSDRNLLQMIVAEMQLVRRESGQLVWTAMERDGAGSYLAMYRRSAPDTVIKRKTRYVEADGVSGRAGNIRVDMEQSDLCFRLDAEHRITSLDGTSRVLLGDPASDNGRLAITTEIHLKNLRTSRAPEAAGSLSRAAANVDSAPIVTHKTDPDQVRAENDRRLIEGRTTESLLNAALEKSQDTALPYRLAALFRLRPDAIPAAVALLRKNGSERRITDGLGSAATAPAIVALSTLAYDRSGPPALRADALLAFAGVQHPTAAAMRVPAAFIDDQDSRVASAARLVSGTQARMGRPEHPAEAAAIDDALANRFENAKGAEDAVDLLAALGNSANPKLLPLIRNALYDTRPVVRAQAARSLRLLAGDETDRLLSNAIMSDADSNVRSAAIFASSFRHPVGATLTKALSHAAKLDNADSVRSSAVSLLGHDAEPTPEVAQSLEWVADHDPKPAIRQIAREALERITGPGAR